MLGTPSPQPGMLAQYWPHVCTVLVAVLGFVVLGPNSDIVAYGSFRPTGPTRTAGTLVTGRGFIRTDVYFPSGDANAPLLHGWWYRPKVAKYNEKLPTVLMASGLGAQIDFGMEKYAEYFAAGGLQALLFDYRGFGSSSGAVRNLCAPSAHLADWRAALNYLNQDPDRQLESSGQIGLWGSSMSGGHVLVLAGEERQKLLTAQSLKRRSVSSSSSSKSSGSGGASQHAIRAVVSQSPHLDGRINRKKNIAPPPVGRGLIGALKLTRAALADMFRTAVGLSPAYVPIVGPLGSVSLMPLPPDELQLYFAKHPPSEAQKGGGWQNKAPARLALLVGSYSPIDSVAYVEAPVLFVGASEDTLCPASLVAAAHKECGYGGRNVTGACELLTVDCGHFGLYAGSPFNEAAGAMLNFFKKHLFQ